MVGREGCPAAPASCPGGSESCTCSASRDDERGEGAVHSLCIQPASSLRYCVLVPHVLEVRSPLSSLPEAVVRVVFAYHPAAYHYNTMFAVFRRRVNSEVLNKNDALKPKVLKQYARVRTRVPRTALLARVRAITKVGAAEDVRDVLDTGSSGEEEVDEDDDWGAGAGGSGGGGSGAGGGSGGGGGGGGGRFV